MFMYTEVMHISNSTFLYNTIGHHRLERGFYLRYGDCQIEGGFRSHSYHCHTTSKGYLSLYGTRNVWPTPPRNSCRCICIRLPYDWAVWPKKGVGWTLSCTDHAEGLRLIWCSTSGTRCWSHPPALQKPLQVMLWITSSTTPQHNHHIKNAWSF